MRLERARQGVKLFTADEIRSIIAKAGTPMKAMVLLGINGGFGNSDCGNLPITALDLERGWIDFPRPKTGVPRRCPLWSETVQALKDVLAKRPEPKNPEHAGLVFITKYGERWSKEATTNPVSQEMGKVLRALKINGRKGLSFYTLRHTFRTTWPMRSKDQPAVDHVMGHENGSHGHRLPRAHQR